MRVPVSTAALLFVCIENTAAFVVVRQAFTTPRTSPLFGGYLDDLSKNVEAQENADRDAEYESDSKEMTDMASDKLDRYGPGDFSQFKVRLRCIR
jgi:hypothetical protein